MRVSVSMCLCVLVCACLRACVRAFVRACVRACVRASECVGARGFMLHCVSVSLCFVCLSKPSMTKYCIILSF